MAGSMTQRTVERIRTMIDNGEVGRSGKLIPEREMAEKFAVSRSTVRAALGELEKTGEIVRKVGRGGGAFVRKAGPRWNSFARVSVESCSHRVVEYEAGKPSSITDALRQQGLGSETELLSAREQVCSTAITENLGFSERRNLYVIEKLRRSNGEPISLETSYVNPECLPDFLESSYLPSIYSAIQMQYGLHIAHIDERIEVFPVNSSQARYLQIEEGQPSLLVSSWGRDDDGNVLEYSWDLFRADRVALLVSHDFSAGFGRPRQGGFFSG